MGSIPINHLGNYAKPLKCLNDQGGRKLNLTIYDGRKYDVQFPISYAKECIGVLQTLEWPTAIGGASVAYTDKELLLAIQSLLMHLVHHIIVIYFMLH